MPPVRAPALRSRGCDMSGVDIPELSMEALRAARGAQCLHRACRSSRATTEVVLRQAEPLACRKDLDRHSLAEEAMMRRACLRAAAVCRTPIASPEVEAPPLGVRRRRSP
mmetsp:Transcript_107899/g.310923  ORF Transcript_107899/g.310923 Transcript_107899/m.310923 type:complete len:110 (+) Transcript_107899:2102-2431(+)